MKEWLGNMGGSTFRATSGRGQSLPAFKQVTAGQANGAGIHFQPQTKVAGRFGDMFQVVVYFLFRQSESLGKVPYAEVLPLQQDA